MSNGGHPRRRREPVAINALEQLTNPNPYFCFQMAEQSPRVKLSGLWKGKTEKGVTYLSGGNGSTRYSIWPNGFKDEGENQPDYILYVEAAKKKTEETED